MLEGFTYTDWLLICVLWFQVAIVLSLWWPRLSQLRLHGKGKNVQKENGKVKDAYEKMVDEQGGEKTES